MTQERVGEDDVKAVLLLGVHDVLGQGIRMDDVRCFDAV